MTELALLLIGLIIGLVLGQRSNDTGPHGGAVAHS